MSYTRPGKSSRGPTIVSAVVLIVALVAVAQVLASRYGGPIARSDLTAEEWVAESLQIGWSPATASAELAADLFERVNDERIARGLPPLAWDQRLAGLAREWSEEMISSGFEHSPASFRDHPGFAGIGENIAMGHTNTSQMHTSWMESEGHRVNILEPGFTAIGIGLVCRNDGLMWATQMFGAPDAGPFQQERHVPPLEPIIRSDQGLRC